MKIDCHISPTDIERVPTLSQRAEEMGFDGIWASERTHSPYTVLALVAHATKRVDIGSAVALAFPRSPMVTAYTAWDIHHLSEERLKLGLGTQVKGHMERRFSVDFEWSDPGRRFREYVESLEHIWIAWQHGREIEYGGEFYEITFCPEEWTPDHTDMTRPELFVGGVNPFNLKLAGHLCGGLHIHALHTPKYIREEVLPNVKTGAEMGQGGVDEVTSSASVFIIPGTEDERREKREEVREQIAFYGATRTYRRLFTVHGWGDVCDTLYHLANEQRWDELSDHVSDEMLSTFGVEADWPDLRGVLESRYGGTLDRITPVTRFNGRDEWNHLTES